jgi:ADP-heptose:LPS heptosyltransferase
MPKFLIIRFSSIGDIVLTTPVVRCLKTQMPQAEIHYLTKKTFASILIYNPYIDKIISYQKSLSEVLPTLKNEGYDYIIDLHHNIRSLKVKWQLNAKSYSFPKLNVEKWLATALKIQKLPPIHIVDRYLSTLSDFGIKNDGKGLDYFIPDEDKKAVNRLPLPFHNSFIGLVIGAALPTKKLPTEKLREICLGLKCPIALLGGPEDAAAGEVIGQNLPNVFNACGKFTLNESAGLVANASVIISHDTGLMHIAAAFQKPIISIWGNTIPEFGMGPYYGSPSSAPNQTLFEIKDLPCRPCSKIGYKTCPKGHFNCMQMQDIQKIVATCQSLFIS